MFQKNDITKIIILEEFEEFWEILKVITTKMCRLYSNEKDQIFTTKTYFTNLITY